MTDDQSKGSKLKSSIFSLESKKTSLTDQRDDLQKKFLMIWKHKED